MFEFWIMNIIHIDINCSWLPLFPSKSKPKQIFYYYLCDLYKCYIKFTPFLGYTSYKRSLLRLRASVRYWIRFIINALSTILVLAEICGQEQQLIIQEFWKIPLRIIIISLKMSSRVTMINVMYNTIVIKC